MTRRTVILALVIACIASLFAGARADASYIVVRNASKVRLIVDKHNHALVSYTSKGSRKHTLWWGAMNARWPDRAHPDSQKRFRYDYSGGSGSFGAGYWKRMKNVCGPYTGPDLPMVA